MSIRERGLTLNGFTDRVELTSVRGHKRTYLVTVNYDDEGPLELILTAGRSGSSENADAEALGRLISLGLQQRVPLQDIARTLENIQGAEYGTYSQRLVHSKADLCAAALLEADKRFKVGSGALQTSEEAVEYTDEGVIREPVAVMATKWMAADSSGPVVVPDTLSEGSTKWIATDSTMSTVLMEGCPECGTPLIIQEGCVLCSACGYSRCG